MRTLKNRLQRLEPPPGKRERHVLHAGPFSDDIETARQKARELEAQGHDVLLIHRVIVDPPNAAV